MAKPKKQSKQDEKAKKEKAADKATAKAEARTAALVADAKKARKTADKAVKAADKAQAKAFAGGAPAPKAKPDEAELLKLALRSAEAKLTDAERRVAALEQQVADFRRLGEQAAAEELEDAVVEAAIVATVLDAVADTESVADASISDAEVVEAVAVELEAVVAEAEPAPEEPSHEGEAAAAAEVLAAGDPGDEPTVTTSELTPPLPAEESADEPNEAWTLLRLRAAAKERGLTGTSNLPKAALLARLRAR